MFFLVDNTCLTRAEMSRTGRSEWYFGTIFWGMLAGKTKYYLASVPDNKQSAK